MNCVLLYNNLKRNGLGDFNDYGYYASSTESDAYDGVSYVIYMSYDGSVYWFNYRGSICNVRPVRAF